MIIKYDKKNVDNRDNVLDFLEKHKNQVLTKDEQRQLITLCNIPNNTKNRVKSSVGVIAKYINSNFKDYQIVSRQIYYKDQKMNRRWNVIHYDV